MDLIVIATHGRTGIGRWTMGSTADKIARAAKCPILLIRAFSEKTGPFHLKSLLVPLDGSKEAESALAPVQWLSQRLNAKVMLLHVLEPLHHIYASSGSNFFAGGVMLRVPHSEQEMRPFKEVAENYLKSIEKTLQAEGIMARYEIPSGASFHNP